MDTSGSINALGRQYIGAAPANTTSGYIPGVVSGGDGGRPSNNSNVGGSPSATSVLPPVFSPLAVALFVALLI